MRREPVGVERSADGWLGIFTEAGKTHTISIRKDDHANSWITGNGADPILGTPTSP